MHVSMQERSLGRALAIAFVFKTALFASLFVILPVWDTSSQLLVGKSVASRLLVWDNLYFITLAQHGGPVFENEYAFSNAWASVVRAFSPSLSLPSLTLTASFLSLLTSMGSCAILFYLTNARQLAGIDPKNSVILYALCPAGVFLICGYAESPFAFLSFSGLYFYLKHRAYICSGIFFGLALQLRSNGLVWGVMYAFTLYGEVQRKKWRLKTIIRIITGGTLVFAGFVGPQIYAYYTYCPQLAWCSSRVPFIYLYVQSHYWKNGFLGYWTLSNAPNFLLAAPTLVLLVKSSRFLYRRDLRGLAAAQMITVVGALFFWHVQIITRVASCFPGPYWYVASLFSSDIASQRTEAKQWVTYFVLWGLVQAALFGAFLPPA